MFEARLSSCQVLRDLLEDPLLSFRQGHDYWLSGENRMALQEEPRGNQRRITVMGN